MSNDDGRSAQQTHALPRKFVHDLRNALGVAVGTADLLLLSVDRGPQVNDLEKIRDACLQAVSVLDEWDGPVRQRDRGPRAA